MVCPTKSPARITKLPRLRIRCCRRRRALHHPPVCRIHRIRRRQKYRRQAPHRPERQHRKTPFPAAGTPDPYQPGLFQPGPHLPNPCRPGPYQANLHLPGQHHPRPYLTEPPPPIPLLPEECLPGQRLPAPNPPAPTSPIPNPPTPHLPDGRLPPPRQPIPHPAHQPDLPQPEPGPAGRATPEAGRRSLRVQPSRLPKPCRRVTTTPGHATRTKPRHWPAGARGVPRVRVAPAPSAARRKPAPSSHTAARPARNGWRPT